jgi:hypothetical protein
MSDMNKRLVYERDSWYDEYIEEDTFLDDGSVVYSDGNIEHVKTSYDKDVELLGIKEML